MKKLLREFRRFCAKGNILELATGVMIGTAFSSIVNSLVNDVLMPLIGLITGGIDLSGLFVALDFQSYPSISAGRRGCTLNYGGGRSSTFLSSPSRLSTSRPWRA